MSQAGPVPEGVGAFGGMRPYTLPEARLILSHVYCVHHVPESDGWVYPWSIGAGEALCCRCSCREPADLRLYVASEREASEWLVRENEAIGFPHARKPEGLEVELDTPTHAQAQACGVHPLGRGASPSRKAG